jgi:hypothetical protein
MFYRCTLLFFLLTTAALTGCGQYNAGFRSFYSLGTDSYKVAEARIVQLYRNGTFKTNSDSLTKIIGHSIPDSPINSLKNEWTRDGYRKYQLGTVVKQDFVVFSPASQTYYYYEITNCGGVTGCDVHVHSIIKQDPVTRKRQHIPWQDAEVSLREFEDQLLPILLGKTK